MFALWNALQMKKISFFFRDIGNIAGAVAQRGNYFVDAVLNHPNTKGADLQVFCVNSNEEKMLQDVKVVAVKALNQDNRSSFFKRAIDEFFIGLSVGFKSVSRNSDLFVISTPPYISGIIIALFQILLKRRYAIDLRDMYPRAYVDSGIIESGSWLHKLFDVVNKLIFARAAFIVCATKGQASEVQALSVDAKPITIYNGFPEYLLHITRPKSDGFRVVTHGTLGVYQNIEFILDLARSLEQDEVEFVIIGQGSKASMIKQANVASIKLLDELPFEEVIKEVALCDVGLCVRDNSTQSRYSFPVKAWEYIGLKMPTLIYPRCEASDLFPAVDGFYTFNDLNIETMKETILDLKRQKLEKDSMLFLKNKEEIRNYTRENLAKNFSELVVKYSDFQKDEVSSGKTRY